MQHPIIACRLVAGALALAAAHVACAQPAGYAPPGAAFAPPPAAYAPPPAGYSGTSVPPAGFTGTAEPAVPRHFVANRLTPMRTGPREGFDIKAVLPPGTPVTTDGYVGGDWWQVQTRYGTGWVYSRDLSAS